MKQLLNVKGEIITAEVPQPSVGPKSVLVRTKSSCVSIGTELSGVKMAALPLWKRALKQPHHARRVLTMMRDQGIRRVWERVKGMMDAGTPLGYSAAGEIVAVGDLVNEFCVGDRVACAGGGFASHAEIIEVPVNLTVPVPAQLSFEEASTVTLGAIAMQGVRRAAPTLGEAFVVVGLGVLGQITVQLLRAHGCRVLGSDPDLERLRIAKELGMSRALESVGEESTDQVLRFTDGIGADGVIITAAAPENHDILATAMRFCRKKGRVVIVGDVGLNMQRHLFYEKELDVLISTSYGPGRYDPTYEEDGQDYPLAYVRWTEKRNMEEYLRLIEEKKVLIKNLNPQIYELEQAKEAYTALAKPGPKPLLVLLSYPETKNVEVERTLQLGTPLAIHKDTVGVAMVGAGAFATGVHLPNFARLKDMYEVRVICARTGVSSMAAAQRFGVPRATTDFEEILADPTVDLVVICTRHHLHGPMALRALQAGKHVLCEKPLALLDEEIDAIKEFYQSSKNPKPGFMIGFNRRWSPAFARLQKVISGRTTPLVAHYTMNAGYIPLDHWVHSPEGGGRNVGEACHIYDLFHALTGSRCASLEIFGISRQGQVYAANDNFSAILKFEDGSVCSLLYTALGSKHYPKERLEVFVEGKIAVMDDYKKLEIVGSPLGGWRSISQEKGQLEEIMALQKMIKNGFSKEFLEEQLQISKLILSAEKKLMARG